MPACGQARMEEKDDFLAEVKPSCPSALLPQKCCTMSPGMGGKEQQGRRRGTGWVLLQDCEELQPWCSFRIHRTLIFPPQTPPPPLSFSPNRQVPVEVKPCMLCMQGHHRFGGTNSQEAPSPRSHSFQMQARHLQEQLGEALIHTISHWGWRSWRHFSAESSRAGHILMQGHCTRVRDSPKTPGTGSEQSHKEQTEIIISS